MAVFYTKDIWNVNSIASRPGPSFCRKEDAVHVLLTDEDDNFLMAHGHIRPASVQMQRIIVSASKVFEETTLERRIGALERTKVNSLLETVSQKAFKGEQTLSTEPLKICTLGGCPELHQ